MTKTQQTISPQIARFDAYEIHPCHEHENGVEQCEPHEAHFWTLYGHIPGAGVEAIGDFRTKELAEEVLYRITGRIDGKPEAPELLDALRECAFALESAAHLRRLERELLPVSDKARALIAKCTGGT
jgi:hypothetical protein